MFFFKGFNDLDIHKPSRSVLYEPSRSLSPYSKNYLLDTTLMLTLLFDLMMLAHFEEDFVKIVFINLLVV